MKKILVSLLLLVALVANVFVMSGCNLLPGNKNNNGEEEGKTNIHFYHTTPFTSPAFMAWSRLWT